MDLEICDVGSGWEWAKWLAGDQVEYSLRDDGNSVVKSYDSVLTFLKLYDCVSNRLESDEHPEHTVFILVQTDDSVRFGFKDGDVLTSFEELESEVEDFLVEIFQSLDEFGDTDNREEALELLRLKGKLLHDPNQLYEQLTSS